LTPAIHDQIVASVRDMQTLETAACLAGIHRDTLHEWRRRGRAAGERAACGEALDDGELSYLGFEEAVSLARAQAEATAVTDIRSAGAKDWHAHAWLLERSFPEHWGRRSRAEVEVSTGQSDLATTVALGRERREAANARMAAAPETTAPESDADDDDNLPAAS
jgi:hypothetical protein